MRKQYVQINGELVEKGDYYADPLAPIVMPDIQPYQSMADGSMITESTCGRMAASRSATRAWKQRSRHQKTTGARSCGRSSPI